MDAMDRLKKEVGESVDAMNKAAEAIKAKADSEAALQQQLSEAQGQVKALQDAAAAGQSIDAATLDALSDQLDGAQKSLESVSGASQQAAEALDAGASAGEAAVEAAAEVAAETPAAEDTPADSGGDQGSGQA